MALEVMRDILRELYCARSLLRRKGMTRRRSGHGRGLRPTHP